MPSSDTLSLQVHVLAHTHWDREWYHTASRFRQRLSALVEQLLRDRADAAHPFLLDGQAVVLEDVVAVRPDLREPLRAALQSGAIEAGPWYVLADELIPSGEALVRNLLVGRRVLEAMGAVAPEVCYSPDAFGHTGALPSIAAGFGMPVVVLWRGYGGARWPAGDTVRWRGPDGASVIVWHLPPDGYEFGRALPADADAAARRWQEIAATLSARSRTGVVLLANGADHHAMQLELDGAVAALQRVATAAGHTVRRSSLQQWGVALARASEQASLPVVQGELRDSYGYTWTLQGTLATRAWQKRAVARADALLRHDVEPWVALALLAESRAQRQATFGNEPPAAANSARSAGSLGASDLRTLLHGTWRTFLRTLPHDTLCGCSIDAVARALDQRLAQVRSEARGLRDAAINLLLGRDEVAARDAARALWHPRLVVRNRTARVRHGLAEVEMVRTIADVPVGPGSSTNSTSSGPASSLFASGFAMQVLGRRRAYRRRESPQHYPDNDLVEITRGLIWMPQAQSLSGFGLRTIALQDHVESIAHDSEKQTPSVQVSRQGMSVRFRNEYLELDVNKRRVVLRDLVRHRVINDLVQITWQADHGDTYTSAPRGPLRLLRPVRARITARGPLRASVVVTYELKVAIGSAANERLEANARANDQRIRTIRVAVGYVLDACASHVRLDVQGHDRAHDHRLRLSIATGITDPRIIADAAFGPVVRVPLNAETVDQALEHVVHSAPLHRWLASDGGDTGTTIISDGLAEYEVLPDARVVVTLLRATGELSRSSLPERPGHAGWPAAVPGAQGPGRFRAQLAVAPHGRFDPAAAHYLADDVLLPLVAHTWRDAPEQVPDHVDGISLEGERGVVASAVKPAEMGDGLIVRAVNVQDEPRTAAWTASPGATAAWIASQGALEFEHVRLDETPLSDTDANATSSLRPREIRTLRVTSGGITDKRARDHGNHQRDAG